MTEVSIIVPCLNEEATIDLLLNAIRGQSFPLSDMEIVIADGMSTDHTRDRITAYQSKYPEIKIILVDNPKRIIPSGLNCAITASTGEYIIRLDGHSIPDPDYVAKCVDLLKAGVAENVGGLWLIQPPSNHWVARSIAAAAANPIGVGDARYRYGQTAGYVDTVPFGSFNRKLFQKTGLFNENLETNEDYEFNVRIRAGGGRIWFDPQIRSIYFSRSDFISLMKQYFRYGYWKLQMLICFPGTLRWRQALPPLFVMSIIILGIAGIWLPAARFLLAGMMLIYVLVLIAASVPQAIKNKDLRILIGIPISIAIMHITWGSGFLWSMVKSLVRG
ncbi:MAG: glycosyltransferase family 2 protein [Chloroflexi bacterium]|nr:glycosyltransferase family 2 protein [Chloroflexota bacterium]